MSRVRVMSAMAYDLESYDDTGIADPTVTVLGELPGTSRPFEIARVYKGAQGRYEESLAIADADGTIIWESDSRVIELRGMMFEDLFRTAVRAPLPITSADEHTLVLYLDGSLIARVPIFIDAPHSVTSAGVFRAAADAALKKSAVCWLTIPQASGGEVTRPAWYVQQGSALFVLTGGDEQQLPGLEHATTVTVTVKSKDIKAAIGQTTADVRIVDDAEEFTRIATLGMGKRLNLHDGEDALQRWQDTCVLAELTPRD